MPDQDGKEDVKLTGANGESVTIKVGPKFLSRLELPAWAKYALIALALGGGSGASTRAWEMLGGSTPATASSEVSKADIQAVIQSCERHWERQDRVNEEVFKAVRRIDVTMQKIAFNQEEEP